jgi:hypothetical protein
MYKCGENHICPKMLKKSFELFINFEQKHLTNITVSSNNKMLQGKHQQCPP